VYGPAHQVHAAYRLLTSNAKHVAKTDRNGRSRDQLRSDQFFRLLFRTGRDSVIKTKVFVTVPLDKLIPHRAAACVRTRSGVKVPT